MPGNSPDIIAKEFDMILADGCYASDYWLWDDVCGIILSSVMRLDDRNVDLFLYEHMDGKKR